VWFIQNEQRFAEFCKFSTFFRLLVWCKTTCKTPVTPEWRPHSVPTALKNCRTPRCALCKHQQRRANAVQSPRTPCGGVYFKHAQNKRRGLAFPQRVRQHAVATLWGLLERLGGVVSAPRARCKDAV